MLRSSRLASFFVFCFVDSTVVILAGKPADTPDTTPAHTTAILDRSCRDCHSNETRWPWYTNVSPTSWLVANHVNHGREHFNYSQWTSIDEDEQDKLLGGICSLAERSRMPLPSYLWIHRDAKLSPADVKTLCAWSEKMRDMLQ